jgi:CBS domain-containing protein
MSEQKTVRDIMTRNIISVEQNKNALEAARLMTERNISSLIVHGDDETAIGILTERDFLSKVCSKDLQASKVNIAYIMSRIQKSAQPDTPIEVAVQRMLEIAQKFRMDYFIKADKLSLKTIDGLTRILVKFHSSTRTNARIKSYGLPNFLKKKIDENFQTFGKLNNKLAAYLVFKTACAIYRNLLRVRWVFR